MWPCKAYEPAAVASTGAHRSPSKADHVLRSSTVKGRRDTHGFHGWDSAPSPYPR